MRSTMFAFAAMLGLAQGSGVYVKRTVTSKPDYANANFSISSPSGACLSSDAYGSNECTVDWNQDITLSYGAKLTQDVAGGTASADLLIDGVLSYKPTCKVCGENCVLKVPTILWNYTFYPGDCPVKVRDSLHTQMVTFPASPTWGWSVETKLSGSFKIQDTSGADLATATLEITAAPAGATAYPTSAAPTVQTAPPVTTAAPTVTGAAPPPFVVLVLADVLSIIQNIVAVYVPGLGNAQVSNPTALESTFNGKKVIRTSFSIQVPLSELQSSISRQSSVVKGLAGQMGITNFALITNIQFCRIAALNPLTLDSCFAFTASLLKRQAETLASIGDTQLTFDIINEDPAGTDDDVAAWVVVLPIVLTLVAVVVIVLVVCGCCHGDEPKDESEMKPQDPVHEPYAGDDKEV